MSLLVKEPAFYKRFFGLTVLIGLQNLISLSVGLSDNVLLGAYSEPALSGVALANQIQFLLQMLVMGAAEGVVILSSRFWGARDLASVRQATSIGMRIALFVALVLGITVFLFPHASLALFTNGEAAITEGVKYLRIICFSYLFFSATNILLASLRSVEIVRIGFVVSASTLIINVCLNYLLIYGHFGFPRLGVQGSAIATLTARIIEFVIVCFFLKRYDSRIQLRLKDFLSIDLALVKSYIRIGSPILGSNALWGVAMAAQTSILGHMGEAAIAANSIATTIFQMVTVVTYASASATAVIIGKSIGEGKVDKVKGYAISLQVLYVGIGLLTGLILYVIKGQVLGFYSVTPEAKSLALQFMTVLSITAVGTAYQMPVLTGIVRSGGDTRFVLYNDFIFMWLIVLPISALCAFVWNLSPMFVFVCLKSDQILKCFVAIVKVNRFRWIHAFDARKQEPDIA
ncbi:MATE family efflux transporter [Gorillibacterium timonense]|uniref:MATE family efflux transporter n=1 Tax=Gorillibacterium timonense TaxID=1689269 RepID=UPI00071C6A64|nr:MATE family efflux transporter [Gorillibacterium timonense]